MSPEASLPPPPYPKLPVWTTAALSYSTYFRNFPDLLRMSWLWLLLVAALTAFATWQQLSLAIGLTTGAAGLPPHQILSAWLRVLLQPDSILMILASASIAVAWHRLVILREHPDISGKNVATGSFWGYLIIGLALCVFMLVPVALTLMPPGFFLPAIVTANINIHSGGTILFLLFGFFVLYGVPAFLVVRLCLLLPACAIGRCQSAVRQVWGRTSGNSWRLLWGLVLTALPFLLVAKIPLMVLASFPIFISANSGVAPPGYWVRDMIAAYSVTTICNLLILPISIGFLSHAYRHFFEQPLTQPT